MAPTNSPSTDVREPVRNGHCAAGPTSLVLSTLTGPHGEMRVVAVGEVDMATADELLACLDTALTHPSCRTVLVDIRGVRSMGTRGLTATATAIASATARAATAGVRLAVVADHRAVLRLKQLTAAKDWCAIYPTPAAARAAGIDHG